MPACIHHQYSAQSETQQNRCPVSLSLKTKQQLHHKLKGPADSKHPFIKSLISTCSSPAFLSGGIECTFSEMYGWLDIEPGFVTPCKTIHQDFLCEITLPDVLLHRRSKVLPIYSYIKRLLRSPVNSTLSVPLQQ